MRGDTNPIKVNGEVFSTIKAACKAYGINVNTFNNRRNRNGWSIKKALTVPLRSPNEKPVKFKGTTYSSIAALCKAHNVIQNTFVWRRDNGWTIAAALGLETRENQPTDDCDGTVYIITNTKNDKVYVGITINPIAKRMMEHLRLADGGKTTKLHKTIAKIGKKHFSIKGIKKTNSRKELARLEKYYIKKYNSVVNGYNSSSGGEGLWTTGLATEYGDKTFATQKELARHLGVSEGTISYRLTEGKALTDKIVRKIPIVIGKTEFATLAEAARYAKVNVHTMYYRHRNGLPLLGASS